MQLVGEKTEPPHPNSFPKCHKMMPEHTCHFLIVKIKEIKIDNTEYLITIKKLFTV